MFSLEDQIEIYTDEHFNASHAAQHFFTSYGESEISKKRADMTKIQQQIENVLKQNVRNKYTDFLIATEQINQVGHEMLELKHLIENTQKLVEDARAVKASNDFKGVKNTNLSTGSKDQNTARINQAQKKFEEIKQERKAAAADASVPSWLVRAADDVAQYIVEQQYQKAVAVVIKTRSYVDGLKKLKSMQASDSSTTSKNTPSSSINSPPTISNNVVSEKALLALDYVNERATHLAVTIKKSLALLPNSPLWGMQELFKRLKLLIALNEFRLAAEGFAQIKEQAIQSAIFSVEITSDTYNYCSELSRIFYQELTAATITYFQLFDEQKESNHEITGLLLQWIQTQISVYVQMLNRQICFAVNDATTVLLVHLKDANNYTKPAANKPNNTTSNNNSGSNQPTTNSGNDGNAGESTKRKRMLFRAESTMSVERVNSVGDPGEDSNDSSPPSPLPARSTNSGNRLLVRSSTANSLQSPQPQVLVSGIPILIKCLHVVFQAAVDHQNSNSILSASSSSSGNSNSGNNATNSERKAKSIPVYPILIYFLMPQVKSLFYHYTDDISKEISSQIRQDSWNFLKSPSLTVKVLSNIESSNTMTRLNSALNPEHVIANDGSNDESNTRLVSLSYIWMIAVLNIFTEDTYNLLNSVKSSNYNLRNDFSEIEPVAVTCLLRILLRYIVEMEAVDYTSLSKVQQECFRSTIEAIIYFLIPSLQKLMEDYFLLERLSLLSNPPNIVFKTIIMRLFRIMNEVESSVNSNFP